MIERRRIWTGAALAGYIRDELGFPGARQGAMVEKEAVDIAAGEVSRERWYLLTSLSSRRCGPGGADQRNCFEGSATTGGLRTACAT